MSARFSPLNKSPSERAWIGSLIEKGVLFTDSANVAVNGVGRNGKPNGTSASNTYLATGFSPGALGTNGLPWKCAAVNLASAGTFTVLPQLREPPGASGVTSAHVATGSAPKPLAATLSSTLFFPRFA